MKTITIYHNPRCGKSRAGLAIAKELAETVEVRNYLKEELSLVELKKILKQLDYMPLELVRKNESLWRAEFKKRDLTDKEVAQAMIANPKLIERPILVIGDQAIIGRPTEKIEPWIKSKFSE
jgi:arsenate reductase